MSNETLIELHHFGEVLVEIIIKALGPENFQLFLKDYSFRPGQGKKGLSDLPFRIGNFHVESFAKIKSLDGYEFDSESDIDVGIFFKDKEESYCFPIEVKMGYKGPIASWSSFTNYMVNKKPVSLQANGKVLNGSMPSLISGTTINEKQYELRATTKDDEYNAKFTSWGLCIRTNAQNFLNQSTDDAVRKRDEKIKIPPFVFHFDDLKAFALSKGVDLKTLVEDKLNSAVKETVKIMFP